MVLCEVANALGRFDHVRAAVVELIKTLRQRPDVTIVPQTASQFRAALEIYAKHLDKSWSLTDCASRMIMEEQGISEALTSDHHFEQMGFVILLK